MIDVQIRYTLVRNNYNYVYADKGSKLYVDNYNHAIDGIRYNVIYHLDNPNYGRYYVQQKKGVGFCNAFTTQPDPHRINKTGKYKHFKLNINFFYYILWKSKSRKKVKLKTTN